MRREKNPSNDKHGAGTSASEKTGVALLLDGDGGSATHPRYTAKQGQYLAFIYYYTLLHRRAPAEADFRQYFRVTPPSVHNMIVTLERAGLISRVPGEGRSIRLRLTRAQLPDLRADEGADDSGSR